MGNGLQGSWRGGNQSRPPRDGGRSFGGGGDGQGQGRGEPRDNGGGPRKGAPQGYRELIVWQKALELAVVAHGLIGKLPAEERDGLGAELLRAAVAAPARIAAGQAGDRNDFGQALGLARSHVAELDTLLIIAVELGHLKGSDLAPAEELMGAVRALTIRLMQRLRDGPKSQN